MNTRIALGYLLLAVLVISAGCTGFFGSSEVDEEALSRDASYEWDETSTDVYVNVTGDQYQAIYTLSGQSEIQVYELAELGEERPIDIGAVQFQYPNGTIVNASEIDVEKRDSRTVIAPPGDTGKVAYTAKQPGGRNFQTPTVVEGGSYEIVLPENTHVGNPFLGTVSPRGYESVRHDGRLHLRWDEVNANSIEVRYYLARDMWLFLGIGALAAVIGFGMIVYLWLQIRQLIRRREELGLDVDIDRDDIDGGGGPPRP